MKAFRRALAGLLLTVASVTAPAYADSGVISNIQPTGTGAYSATFSVEWSSCKDYGYGIQGCSWYAKAYVRPSNLPCFPDGSFAWVGEFHDAPGLETATHVFYPDSSSFKLCLFVNGQGASTPTLIHEATYAPPPPTPEIITPAAPSAPPSPAPVGSVPAPSLSLSNARRTSSRLLRERYGPRWNRGAKRRVICDEINGSSVTCAVSWRFRRIHYAGTITLRPTTGGHVAYSIRVRRK